MATETHPGITSNSVIYLSLDLQGRLYLGTLRGVNRITLPPGSEDDPNAWKVERFGPAEGLPSQICYDRASMRDAQGRVWIGTLRGAAILDPARTPVQEPPVPVVLDHVWVGGEEFFGESRLSLKYTQHQLTVAYSLPQFHEVEEQRFQSQLLPIEERPTPWQKAGRRELSGLAPGSYLLRIWGRDHLGRVTGPLAFPFEAQAPPWKRPWAYLVYAALGALLLQALTRWRLRRLEANNRTLQAHVQAAVAATEAQRQLLERSNEEKNRMMGILAHDLRNPLGAIRLYADELVEFPDDAEETRNNATRIGKAVDRMLEMIIRLLDFNAIDTGRITLKLQPIQVGEMLQVIEEEQEPKARAKGLKVALDLAPDAPPLVGDAMHLKEVLDNLVSNAIKFMVPGPPARQVTLRLRPGLIEVQDEGPGFAPEDISKVFGRFERLSARPTGGETSTGLGLSIVKSLVEAMGGSVQLRSEPGAGACFQIRLPLA